MKDGIKPLSQSGNERGVVWEHLQSDKSLIKDGTREEGGSGERREQRAHLGWAGGQVPGQRGAECASARRKRTRERGRE